MFHNPRVVLLVAFLVRFVYVLVSIAHHQTDTTFQGTEIAFGLISENRNRDFIPLDYEEERRSYLWPMILAVPLKIGLLLGFNGLAIFIFLQYNINQFSSQ